MGQWFLSAFFTFGLFFHVFGTIIITEFSGTDRAQFRRNNVLQCKFAFEEETGVEVKWFYNDHKQIVSWIPTKNKPQAIGDFKSILDFTDVDDTMKSVILFKDLTFNLTGRYTCKVSGNEDEASKTQNMVVYQPASIVEFVEEDNGTSITCSASDLFPMANITISGSYVSGRNDPVSVSEEFENVTETDDNFYNVSKTVILDRSALNQSVIFFCHIFIPETSFNQKLNITIEVESYETTTEYVYTDDYHETTSTTTAPITKGNFAIASSYPSLGLLLSVIVLSTLTYFNS